MKKPQDKKATKKDFLYDQQTKSTQYLEFKDMAVAAQYGALPLDQRVQVKMPRKIIEALDKAFPHITRSQLITELALDALLRKLRFPDPDFEQLSGEEQQDLDDDWEYLESRDAQ